MTMHDDSNLELLERDLTALSAPREADERLRLALRGELAATLRSRPARRRRSIRFPIGVATVAVAAAAAAVVALVGTGAPDGPSPASAAIVHHALEAVTPPANAVLHTEVVGVQNGVAVIGETWQETSPPYASRGLKGPSGHTGEFADDGTNSFEYDPTTNTISEQPDSSKPTFADPMAQVREELASGQAQETGTVTIAGVSLYRIDLPHGLIGYFDTVDYLPRYLDDPQRNGSVVRLRVAAYKYLPMTPASRALLSITAQHPRAQIVPGGSAATDK
ncbi:MAG: hypothetical protein ACTHMY_20785 [Solirubrobacteraceae bacterium]